MSYLTRLNSSMDLVGAGRLVHALIPSFSVRKAFVRHFRVWSAVLATSAILASSPASGMVIDEFQTRQTLAAIRPAGSGAGALDSPTAAALVPEALGGEREIVTGIIQGGFATVLGANRWGEGQLTHSARGGAKTYSLVIWDGDADEGDFTIDPDGLGGLDFLGMGLNAFCVRALFSDHPSKVSMTVYSAGDTSGGTRATYTINMPGNINSSQDFHLPFSSFVLEPGSLEIPVFSDIGAIVLKITDADENSLDVSLDMVEAVFVPEPSASHLAGILMAAAMVALLARKKSLRHVAA